MNKFVNKTVTTPTTDIYTEETIRAFNLLGMPADADHAMISAFGFDLLPSATNTQSSDTDVLVASKDQNNNWQCEWTSISDFNSVKEAQHKAVLARANRDRLLARTDWTQGKDISTEVSNKWTEYRQALRDITSQEGFPNNIQWPVQPQ